MFDTILAIYKNIFNVPEYKSMYYTKMEFYIDKLYENEENYKEKNIVKKAELFNVDCEFTKKINTRECIHKIYETYNKNKKNTIEYYHAYFIKWLVEDIKKYPEQYLIFKNGDRDSITITDEYTYVYIKYSKYHNSNTLYTTINSKLKNFNSVYDWYMHKDYSSGLKKTNIINSPNDIIRIKNISGPSLEGIQNKYKEITNNKEELVEFLFINGYDIYGYAPYTFKIKKNDE